ncbi:hypothetical protein BJV74DRAFT_263964 [Russula compacta]|nr:hypothetical protein BJV74DRAFT_263964 [Russula compacta]
MRVIETEQAKVKVPHYLRLHRASVELRNLAYSLSSGVGGRREQSGYPESSAGAEGGTRDHLHVLQTEGASWRSPLARHWLWNQSSFDDFEKFRGPRATEPSSVKKKKGSLPVTHAACIFATLIIDWDKISSGGHLVRRMCVQFGLMECARWSRVDRAHEHYSSLGGRCMDD